MYLSKNPVLKVIGSHRMLTADDGCRADVKQDHPDYIHFISSSWEVNLGVAQINNIW